MMLPKSTVLHSIGAKRISQSRLMMNRMRRIQKTYRWQAANRSLQPLPGSNVLMSLLVITLLGLTYLLSNASTLGLILAVLLWILLFYLGYIILTYWI